jgi:ABC-type multidrug transport system fused ATPase/permease subunit
VAFVGPIGCGKTTLLSTVSGLLRPCEGRVLIDGVDLASVDLRSLRRQIGVVTQEPLIVRDTILANILLGMRSRDESAAKAAAGLALADEFIQGLSDGYQTEVGEFGSTLSGGQRQRLAIARAIMRNPSLMILDEATSAIDAESEDRINDAVLEFGRGRTVLVIAHRMATILAADRIVVMNEGRIVDDGTHAELLERCSLYERLARPVSMS